MDEETLEKAGEGDVRNRDTDGATGIDKFDRAAMPRVMQVKDFGFAGRTKYTHLADQDTTFLDQDNPFNGLEKQRLRFGPVSTWNSDRVVWDPDRRELKRAPVSRLFRPLCPSSHSKNRGRDI